MTSIKNSRLPWLAAVSTLLLTGGCSLSPPPTDQGDGVRILLEDGQSDNTTNLAESLLSLPIDIASVPTSITDFTCFAVNVTGTGVPPSNSIPTNCTSPDNFRGKGGGITSRPTPRGQPIVLQIPTGTGRSFDVYGLYPAPHECGGTSSSSPSQGYFVGNATADIQSDSIIPITVTYSSTTTASITCTNSGSSSILQFGNGADGPVNVTAGLSVNVTSNATLLSGGKIFSSQRVVTAIGPDGSQLGLGAAIDATGLDFAVGDEVMWIGLGANGTGCGPTDLNTGYYNFVRVTAFDANSITVNPPITASPASVIGGNLTNTASNANFCRIGVVRVPNITNLTINGSVGTTEFTAGGTPLNYGTNGTSVGVIAVKVNGTLTYSGGSGFSGFNASGSGYAGGAIGGGGAGLTGEMLGGSGGGPGTTGVQAGGGGAGHAGAGGAASDGPAGTAYPGCSGPQVNCLRHGSGGGGGPTTGGTGGPGGGIVYVAAQTIANSGHSGVKGFFANGANGTAGAAGIGTGAGGGGGSVVVRTQSDGSALSIQANGGNGGAASTTGNSGGGGAGGLAAFDSCSGIAPSVVSNLGVAGTVATGTAGASGTAGSGSITISAALGFCGQ